MAISDKHLIEMIKAHEKELYESYHVESLSVFGSVSRGDAGPDSDVDILVRYYKTPGIFSFLSLKQFLETILGKQVDLVTESALKKNMRQEILNEAIRVA